jgi:sortase A
MIVGASLLGYVGAQYFDMYRTQHNLESKWQRQASAAARLSRPMAAPIAVLTRLQIPRIKLDAIVLEGTTRAQLGKGPGHLEETATPGETGNAVITAHRDTFFRHLFELNQGDEIIVRRGADSLRFHVTGKKIVEPDDLSVLRPTPDAQLTLITCYPTYYIGPAPQRLVVFSKLDE